MRTADPKLHERRKAEIIEAATRCFVKKGFHQASINDICKEVGLTPGGLYRYFDTKEDIIRAASDLETNWFREEVKKIGPEDNISEALVKIAMIAIKAYNKPDKASFIAEIYAEAARNPTIGTRFSQNDQETKSALAGFLKTAKTDSRVTLKLSPDETAEIIIALVDGYSTRILVDPKFKPSSVAKKIRHVIESLIKLRTP